MTVREAFLESETDVTGGQLTALASGAITAAEHRHASLGWVDLVQLEGSWAAFAPPDNPQYRVNADGFVEFRGVVTNPSVLSAVSTIANFPLDNDNTQAPFLNNFQVAWTSVRPTNIPESGSILAQANVTTGSTALRFQPLAVNAGNFAPGAVRLDGLSYTMLAPCLTKIFTLGDSFVSGAFAAITSESGLSTVGKTHVVIGFGDNPPAQAGQTTNNVLTFLTQYVDQIEHMPGPIMVYMTIGTVDQGFGFLLSQIAGSIDTIVSTILDSRPDVVVIFAGYSFESSFPSDFIPLLRSATNFPGRFEYIDLYDIDGDVSQVGGGDDHPDDAGHAERLRVLYERITIVAPPTFANSCP